MKDFALLSLKINIKNQFKQYYRNEHFNIFYEKGINHKDTLNSNNIKIENQFESIKNEITSQCYIDIELSFFYDKKHCILYSETDIYFNLKYNNNIVNTVNQNIEENEKIGLNKKKRKATTDLSVTRDIKHTNFQENLLQNLEYNFEKVVKLNFIYEITNINYCYLHSFDILLEINQINKKINEKILHFDMDDKDEDPMNFVYRMEKLTIQN